jgi:glycosyltransferase involved in cell wall biosynthesis
MAAIEVSIIVPNYNHAIYLEQRLDSIFNQTFQDFEVILLDDASTDNSLEILKKYSHHSKVNHFIINERNSGSTFKQWQKGIGLAKGEFIWIAESDDWADERFLEISLGVYRKNPILSLVFCGTTCVNEKGNKIPIQKFELERWNQDFISIGNREIENELIYHNSICNTSSVLFTKVDLENVDLSDYLFCGDWKVVIDIVFQKSYAFNAQKLNFYRVHSQGVTYKVSNIERELLRYQEYTQTMKYALKKMNQRSILYRKRHRWIIFEWLNLFEDFKDNKRYYCPPFPIYLSLLFYVFLIKRILSTKK